MNDHRASDAIGMRVALFITCLTGTFFPEVGRAMVRVLHHFGCVVEFPAEQTCCGQPARNAGFEEEARTLARRWVQTFGGSEWIVTPSASCAGMVKHQFPLLLADEPDACREARSLGERTFELTGFLEDVLGVRPGDLPKVAGGPFACVHSCHSHGRADMHQVSDSVTTWTGEPVRPCARGDQCCGFGGVFAIDHPRISEAMALDKLRALEETGARSVTCNEAGCTLHLSGVAHRNNVPVRFKHIAELLAEALDEQGTSR